MMAIIEQIKSFLSKLQNRLTSRLCTRRETQELLITSGGLVIVFLVVLVVSFAKPVTEQLNETLFIEHFGEFSYQADALPGIYDNSYAQTGEPFFWDISDQLHAEFSYRSNGVQLRQVQGTSRFTAYLMDEHGWQRTLEAGEEASFTEFPHVMAIDLDLDDIASVLNNYQRQTGISRNNYFLVLQPHIQLQGTVSGTQVASDFSPQLVFYVTTTEFYLVSDDEVTLKPELIESVTKLVEQSGSLNLFSISIPIPLIRWASLLLLLFSLGYFAIILSFHAEMLGLEDPTGLAYRFGEWIVDVSKMPDETEMIWINEFDQLARIAELYDLVIMHNQKAAVHYYYIKAEEGYFYHCVGEE